MAGNYSHRPGSHNERGERTKEGRVVSRETQIQIDSFGDARPKVFPKRMGGEKGPSKGKAAPSREGERDQLLPEVLKLSHRRGERSKQRGLFNQEDKKGRKWSASRQFQKLLAGKISKATDEVLAS